MSVFNQDLGSTPITANVIQDAIKMFRGPRPNCYITEAELEQIIWDVVESIYYSCKVGNIPVDQTWRFNGSLFGVTKMPEVFWTRITSYPPVRKKVKNEYQRIKNYIESRFIKLGFIYSFDENNNCVVLSIPSDKNDIESVVSKIYVSSVSSNILAVQPMSKPTGMLAWNHPNF